MPKLFDPSFIIKDIPALLKYLPVTLEIALVSILFSLLLGFIIAMVKIKKIAILKPFAEFFVSFMRGTPMLVQLYLSYYGIPIILQYINYYCGTHFSINDFPKMVFVLVAFSLNEGAFASETIRAAILSVDKGQLEAALSIGMTNFKTFLWVVLPEAMIVAIPSLGSQFIGLVKGTSLAFVCAVIEMTAAGKLVAGRNLRHFEMYIGLSMIYWVITIILSRLFVIVEKKLRKSDNEVVYIAAAQEH